MNCVECRESLVAWVEGLLEAEQSAQCRAHLEGCAACRAEAGAIKHLQERLAARGQTAAQVSIAAPVMRRVLQAQTQQESDTIMSRLLKHRWGFGLGTAAGAAAILLVITLAAPRAQAKAEEVLAKGARAIAKLSSVHFRGQLRTRPQDNFGYIDPGCEFYSVEMWKQFEPDLKWRAEKPGRVAVMDGQSTLLFIKPANLAMKVPKPSPSAFDTEWLHKIANLSTTIDNELKNAQAKGWKLTLKEEQGTDGRAKAVVSIEAKFDLPENDYLKNKFVDTADTRRVYRFDAQTELLEALQVYLARPSGDVLIFELQQIDYNQPIASAVFHLDLPADVNWYKELQKLPDNAKYASMTPEQAARAFFEACGRSDWTEVEKFFQAMPFNQHEYVGGLEIISLGESFTSQDYPGKFVPYEIKFKNGEMKKLNLALKKDLKTSRWFVDGGF